MRPNSDLQLRRLCWRTAATARCHNTVRGCVALALLALCSCTTAGKHAALTGERQTTAALQAASVETDSSETEIGHPHPSGMSVSNPQNAADQWTLITARLAGDAKPEVAAMFDDPPPTPRRIRLGAIAESSTSERATGTIQLAGDRKPAKSTRGWNATGATFQQPSQQVPKNQRVITIVGASYDADATPRKQTAPAATLQPVPKPESKAIPPQNGERRVASKKKARMTPVFSPARPGNAQERFSLKIQQADISEVMEMLGQMSQLNVFLGKNVTGSVSANLRNVTVDEAIQGILKSMDFVAEQDGRFLYVMTSADAAARKKSQRKLISKIYRPHYISVKDLQALVTPLLTPKPIGKVAVTSASEIGLETDAKKAGGDSLTQRDALLIQDYAEIIREIDAVVAEMDVPPMQVVIESMILQVTLNDEMALGVNFALLSNSRTNLLVSGNGRQLNNSTGFPGAAAGADSILPAMGTFIAPELGLKYGFLRGDISGFVEALETVGDTNLIASPQIRVLNKQKAHLIIGDRLGFSTFTNNGTESIQNISFLDVGTKLVIRPFIAPDGLVRLEVHPEQSSGFIDGNGIPQSRTTEVTTNVMVRDGSTIVLGGLIETDTTETYDRVPFLGSLPWVGNVFRRKEESTRRRELIVLITPRIVREPADAAVGDATKFESERRAEFFRNNLSRINRTSLTRMHMQIARKSFERGDLLKADRHASDALRHSKNNLEALRLQEQIRAALNERNKQWLRLPFTVSETTGATPGK